MQGLVIPSRSTWYSRRCRKAHGALKDRPRTVLLVRARQAKVRRQGMGLRQAKVRRQGMGLRPPMVLPDLAGMGLRQPMVLPDLDLAGMGLPALVDRALVDRAAAVMVRRDTLLHASRTPA